jgi:hypothetical protein
MKLNDWEILKCVQRTGKSAIEVKGSRTSDRSVDIVPGDPARAAAHRWKKVLERKNEKGH